MLYRLMISVFLVAGFITGCGSMQVQSNNPATATSEVDEKLNDELTKQNAFNYSIEYANSALLNDVERQKEMVVSVSDASNYVLQNRSLEEIIMIAEKTVLSAEIYGSLNRVDLAVNELLIVIKDNDSFSNINDALKKKIYYLTGRLLYFNGDYAGSHTYLQKSLGSCIDDKTPVCLDEARIRTHLGETLLKDKQYEKAGENLNQAVGVEIYSNIDSDSIDLLSLVSYLDYIWGYPIETMKTELDYIESYVDKLKLAKPYYKFHILMSRGRISESKGSPVEASNYFKEAEQFAVSHFGKSFELAQAVYWRAVSEERPKVSFKHLEHSLEIFESLGESQLGLSNVTGALPVSYIVELKKTLAYVKIRLADLYMNSGGFNEASKIIEKLDVSGERFYMGNKMLFVKARYYKSQGLDLKELETLEILKRRLVGKEKEHMWDAFDMHLYLSDFLIRTNKNLEGVSELDKAWVLAKEKVGLLNKSIADAYEGVLEVYTKYGLKIEKKIFLDNILRAYSNSSEENEVSRLILALTHSLVSEIEFDQGNDDEGRRHLKLFREYGELVGIENEKILEAEDFVRNGLGVPKLDLDESSSISMVNSLKNYLVTLNEWLSKNQGAFKDSRYSYYPDMVQDLEDFWGTINPLADAQDRVLDDISKARKRGQSKQEFFDEHKDKMQEWLDLWSSSLERFLRLSKYDEFRSEMKGVINSAYQDFSDLFLDFGGDFSVANEILEKGLLEVEKIYGKDSSELVPILVSAGSLMFDLGANAQARRYYSRAQNIVQNSWGYEDIRSNRFLLKVGRFSKAMDELEIAEINVTQALGNIENVYGMDSFEAYSVLDELASIKSLRGKESEAEVLYLRALRIYDSFASEGDEGRDTLYNNVGVFYLDNNHYKKAQYYLGASLFLSARTDGEMSFSRAVPLSNYSSLLNKMGFRRLAIIYAKKAVNIYQLTRRNIRSMSPEVRVSFQKKVAYTYQNLAEWLFLENQIDMGERVLGMLKDTEQALYQRTVRNSTEPIYESENEKQVTKKMDEIFRDSLRYTLLKEKDRRNALSEVEEQEFNELGASVRHAQNSIFNSMQAMIKKVSYELEDWVKGDLESSSRTPKLLKSLADKTGHRAAVLYLFSTDENVTQVLVTEAGPYTTKTAVSREELSRRIPLFRRALTPDISSLNVDGFSEALKQEFWKRNLEELDEQSRWMYSTLIAPVANPLKESGADTLMVVLNGVLRYIPLSALHDGDHYLIEDYNLSLLTKPVAVEIGQSSESFKNLSVAAMGTNQSIETEAITLDSLAAVEEEVNAVVSEHTFDRGKFHGKKFFNEDFTPAEFYKLSRRGKFPLLHIATHFHMRPGDQENSEFLFGGPELVSVKSISENWEPYEVQLLTLSACSTALSSQGTTASSDGRGVVEILSDDADGAEVDNFAALAISKHNIKTVIATLWNIQDQSTARFMMELYRFLPDSRYTRAGALRMAQLNMLRGKVAINDALKSTLNKSYGLKDYSHPFFWAPFILMGQWQ